MTIKGWGRGWATPSHQADDVAHHAVADEGFLHRVLQGAELIPGQHLPQGLQRIALLAVQHHGHLVLGVGITQTQPDEKPVHLAVRQQLGAGGAHRVLGGDDDKGLRQGMGHPVHRDLPFLHGFQQGRLGPGGGPVQLVRQKQIGDHRAALVAQGASLGVGDAVARDVRGQHVRGKLHPAVF